MNALETATSPDQLAQDRKLAREIARCDPAIIGVLLTDEMGEILDVENPAGSPDAGVSDPNALRKLGALTSIMVGTPESASPVVGKREFVLHVFSDAKVILMPIPSVKRNLALRVSRSANAEYLYRKVLNKFGLA